MPQVFEIHGGGNAAGNGWDFTVCRTLKEALGTLEGDLDGMEEGDEIKIVFKNYTQAEMDEVIFED